MDTRKGPDMDKGSKVLGWLGLVVGGTLSVGANVRSIHLPGMPAADLGAYVAAVAPVVLAMIGIEQVSRWKHLPAWLRFGAVGVASVIAAVASWVHIVAVMDFYGQPYAVARTFPIAVDGIMLLSSVALFVPFPVRADKPAADIAYGTHLDGRTATLSMDTEPAGHVDTPDVDTDTDSTPGPDSFAPDTMDMDTDTLHALVPATRDMDTVDRIPAPRRTSRPNPAWKDLARTLITDGHLTDRQIAESILGTEGHEDTWPSLEAGRKAVSRLR